MIRMQPRFGRGNALAKACAFFAVIGLVSGCSYTTQTTSGRDYLARHQIAGEAIIERASDRRNPGTTKTATFDQALRHVANIEPTISFPARIGIAKIGCRDECGRLVALAPEEGKAWSEMAANLGPSYGTFVPINPLALDLALADATKTGLDVSSLNAVDQLRLGAARQHLDSVIIYEVATQSESETSLFALADLTIIGAFVLPSRKIDTEAYAAAVILDPITGYPYGQVEASAEGDSRYTSTVSFSNNEADALHAAEVDAVVALAKETEKAIRDLRSATTKEDTKQ